MIFLHRAYYKCTVSCFNIVIEFEYCPQDWAINLVKYHNYFYFILSRKLNFEDELFKLSPPYS